MEIVLTEDHEYLVDNQPYPGFTKIAQAMGLIRPYTGDPWFGERGTAVHSACAMIDTGTLDEESVDPAIVGFVEAYKRFKLERGITEWQFIETSFAHSVYHFCGTIDRALPLYDIKTTNSFCNFQLCAYSELLRDQGIDPGKEGYFLHLKEDGSYSIKSYRFNRRDTNLWFSAVSLFHWKKEHGLL